jgi:hypothetical protein
VANPFDPDGAERLEQATRDVFLGPVQRLIVQTLDRFPKAKVIVLGYYPIVSDASSARELVCLMKHLPRPPGVSNTLDWIVEHVADEVIEAAIVVEKRRMVEQCTVFHDVSSALLRAMVASLGPKFDNRLNYAAPAFDPENAFAAPATWLWRGSDDPLHDERVAEYTKHLEEDPFDWPFYTPLASMCHPNVAGAKAYADAIVGALSAG